MNHTMLVGHIRSLLLIGTVFASFPAMALEGYLCIAEHVAGLAFDQSTKQWSATTFKAEKKLLIQRPTEVEAKRSPHWVVKEVGSTRPEYMCKADFTEVGYLTCEGFGDFKFNKKNNRFLSTHPFGYVTDRVDGVAEAWGPEGIMTPTITGGKCSAL